MNAVHVAPDARHSLGMSQAAFAIGENGPAAGREAPRDDARRPRERSSARIGRAEPLVEAIGRLLMHSLKIQSAENHVGLRRENPEGIVVEVPFACRHPCRPAEDVPGSQPPLGRQPRGGNLDLHRRFEGWRGMRREQFVAVKGGQRRLPSPARRVRGRAGESSSGSARTVRQGTRGRSLRQMPVRSAVAMRPIGLDPTARSAAVRLAPSRGRRNRIQGQELAPAPGRRPGTRSRRTRSESSGASAPTSSGLRMIGPDFTPARGSHVQHAQPQSMAPSRSYPVDRHDRIPRSRSWLSSPGSGRSSADDAVITLKTSVVVEVGCRRVESPLDLDFQPLPRIRQRRHGSLGHANGKQASGRER